MKATIITLKQFPRLALLALVMLLVLPNLSTDGLKGQSMTTVEDVLDAGSIGGTRGYRLRRIGAASPGASRNGSFVYYPASAIKVFEHFYAMSLVRLNLWDLNTTMVSNCTNGGNCADTPNSGAGCSAANQSLSTVLQAMMVVSSNAAPNAIQEEVGRLFDPMDPNPAAVGRTVMNLWGASILNMTNTNLNSKFGCVGACGATPNTLTLVDNERLYTKLAGNAILDNAHRVQLKNLMLNEATGYFNSIIDQEAAATNRNGIKAAFKNKLYFIYKDGSWTCSGGRYATIGGLIQLPTYGGAYKRLFTFGAYLHDTDAAAYSGGTVGNATLELLRPAIRAALLTWGNDYVGGQNIEGLASQLDPQVEEFRTHRYGYLLQRAATALSSASSYIPNDSFPDPDYLAGMQQLQIGADFLLQAEQQISGFDFDTLFMNWAQVARDLCKDIQAYAVSTGDGSMLPAILQNLDDDLKDLEGYVAAGDLEMVMEKAVDVAMAASTINWNLNEPVDNDYSIGFAPLLTVQKTAAAVVEMPEVQVWPNPARDQLSVQLGEAWGADVQASAYDLQGREVSSSFLGLQQIASGHSVEISTSNLPEGIYFLKIKDGSKATTKKLVIQH